MTIQAIFFDMGGTLQTFWHSRELRLKATPGIQNKLLAEGIDLKLNNEQLYELITAGLEKYHLLSMQTLDELPAQRVWCEFILKGIVDAQRLSCQAAEDLMFYIETNYYHREMRPEIPSVLQAIKQMGLKIGLISNACSQGQVPANLLEYGILNYFDPIVISSVYGRRKPDPSIFHYAARMAKAPTSECAYIGDRVNRDIVGSRRAGFRLAVQIRHDFKHGETDEGATPDVFIEDMTELLDILRLEQSANKHHGISLGQTAPPIRALLFDAGDILYHRPSAGQKLNQFLIEVLGEKKLVPVEERAALNAKAFRNQMNQDQFREGILRLYGITQPENIARGKLILQEEENDIQFFTGVRNTLIALKESGFLLGIITDTAQPVHVKLNWFEKGGFGHVWDTIISSQEVELCKPDPKIYQAALQQLGISSQQAVFVGHKASELDGARAVGMQTISFNYEPGVRADFTIEEFIDLLKAPVIVTSMDHQGQNG